jgi:hypothetical protein
MDEQEQKIQEAEKLIADRDAQVLQEAMNFYNLLIQQFNEKYPTLEIAPMLSIRKK